MAITIKVEPQEIQPAYNEVMVVLDSTNKSEPKFQYVIDVNVDAVNVSRLKVQSNPQGYGVLNLSKHLEPYIGSDIDVDSADIKPIVNYSSLVFNAATDSVDLGNISELGGSNGMRLDMGLELSAGFGVTKILHKPLQIDCFYDYGSTVFAVVLSVASGNAVVTTNLVDGQLYDISVIYTNNTFTLYLDGVAVDVDDTETGAIDTNTNTMYIGNDTVTDSFLGSLSDFKLYDNSLREHSNIFKNIESSNKIYDVTLSEEYLLTTSFIHVDDDGSGFAEYTYAADHNFVLGDFVTVSDSTVSSYNGIQEVTSVPSSTVIVTTRAFDILTATGNTVLSNGTTTIIPDAAVFTGDKYALNNVVKWSEYNSWNSTDYNLGEINRGKFFTNLPSTMITKLDDRFTLNFFNDSVAAVQTFLKIITDDNRVYYYRNSADANAFNSVAVGAYDLANSDTTLYTGFTSDAAPIITDDTDSYTIELVNVTADTISEVKTFVIDRGCNNNYKLMYLNTGGSFTTFNFELAHSKSVSVKRTDFRKNYGAYDLANNSYGWSASDRGTTRLDTDIKEVITIQSDYIKEAYGNLIEDLIVSPEVYHLDNGVLRSIDVNTNSVKIKQRKTDKLINYSLKFTYSNKNTVQR